MITATLLIFSYMTTFSTTFSKFFHRRKGSDPEIHMTFEQIVHRWGFPVERHEIFTDDDYILTAFRIPYGKMEKRISSESRPVALFMHGLDASSVCFISNLPEKDAPFLFADAGIDVWLGNFRGNAYGKGHKRLTPKNRKFWDFGWDEMAQFDLPATIDYILRTTKAASLYYVGHSMGTTTAFALLASDKKYEHKIRKLYALGPVTTGHHIKGSSRAVLKFVSTISKVFKPGAFISTYALAKKTARASCGKRTKWLCAKVIFLAEGRDTGHINKTRLPVFMARIPSGTSWRTVAHFAQTVKSGDFKKYDFGKKGNIKRYHHDTPPVYDIRTIETPVVVFSGKDDYLAPPADVEDIIQKLRHATSVQLKDYNHVDFIWGKNADIDVYLPMKDDIIKNFLSASSKKGE